MKRNHKVTVRELTKEKPRVSLASSVRGGGSKHLDCIPGLTTGSMHFEVRVKKGFAETVKRYGLLGEAVEAYNEASCE